MSKSIGLALSGGGMRAAVFHTGVLKYIAEKRRLGDIKTVSTVSGAGLLVGLIYSLNGYKWVTDEEYIAMLPALRDMFTRVDLEKRALLRLATRPWENKASILAYTLRKYWGITGRLDELPSEPKWLINATAYETGKRFTFENTAIGAESVGFARPELYIADAIAASAGFPVLIGPYDLKIKNFRWDGVAYPSAANLHLWDGGIVDNLGVAPLFQNNRLVGVDYLIVSNGSDDIEPLVKWQHNHIKHMIRLMDITLDQIYKLRSQDLKEFYGQHARSGFFIEIKYSSPYIARRARLSAKKIAELERSCLSEGEVAFCRDYKTTLAKMPEKDYDLILRHGYEAASISDYCFG